MKLFGLNAAAVSCLATPVFIVALTGASLALAPAARAQEPVFGEKARVLTADPFTQADPHRVFTVQLGAFQSAAKAFALKGLLADLGPTLVDRVDGEKGEKIYRVLLGRFGSLREADEFIETRHLRQTFAKAWIDPVAMDLNLAPDRGVTGPTEKDFANEEPNYVGFTFKCGEKEIRGEYVAKFPAGSLGVTDAPGTLGRVEGAPRDFRVHWSCAEGKEPTWHERELEQHPSYFSIGAVSGMGSLATTNAATGNLNRSAFTYGARLSAYRNLAASGFGPVLDYTLTNNRYKGDAGSSQQTFDLRHEMNAGVRLPFLHRLEIIPALGYAKRSFFVGTTSIDADFKSIYLPQLGASLGLTIFQLKGTGAVGVLAGYAYILSGSNADVAANSSSALLIRLYARGYGGVARPGVQLGSEWFFQYERVGLSATAHEQSASLFSIGLSLLMF